HPCHGVYISPERASGRTADIMLNVLARHGRALGLLVLIAVALVMENSMDSSLAEQQRILASDWGGGKSPFGTSWSKFMMWIFIISDALTFAGFLIAYGFVRGISQEWPKQTEVFNMVLITFMTFALISSSAVMAMAVGAARARQP